MLVVSDENGLSGIPTIELYETYKKEKSTYSFFSLKCSYFPRKETTLGHAIQWVINGVASKIMPTRSIDPIRKEMFSVLSSDYLESLELKYIKQVSETS